MPLRFINDKYSVVFADFVKKNYEKDFIGKYHKRLWSFTKDSIIESLERITNLDGLDILKVICPTNKGTFLCKYDFKIAKSSESAKTSGNRCILEVNNDSLTVTVLMIYYKNHIPRTTKETVWWQCITREVFSLFCVSGHC